MSWRKGLGFFAIGTGATVGVFFTVRQVALGLLESTINLAGTQTGAMFGNTQIDMPVSYISFGAGPANNIATGVASLTTLGALALGLSLGKILYDACKPSVSSQAQNGLETSLLATIEEDYIDGITLTPLPSPSSGHRLQFTQ